MAKLSIKTRVLAQHDLVSSATQLHPLGTRAMDDTGRVFRYVKAGEALVAGTLLQSPAIEANHLATTAANTSVGATSLTFAATGSTAAVLDRYADGLLQVDTTPGNGYTYAVAGNTALAASGTVTLKDKVQVALTTASRLGLMANPYKGVIISPADTSTGIVVGVATYIISSGEYGWIGTWGIFSVLIMGTPALGAAVMAPGSVAGAADVIVVAGNLPVAQFVGHMAQVGADGKNNFVHVRINA